MGSLVLLFSSVLYDRPHKTAYVKVAEDSFNIIKYLKLKMIYEDEIRVVTHYIGLINESEIDMSPDIKRVNREDKLLMVGTHNYNNSNVCYQRN